MPAGGDGSISTSYFDKRCNYPPWLAGGGRIALLGLIFLEQGRSGSSLLHRQTPGPPRSTDRAEAEPSRDSGHRSRDHQQCRGGDFGAPAPCPREIMPKEGLLGRGLRWEPRPPKGQR